MMTGPMCDSGHRVQRKVTVEPAAAGAWSLAGAESALHWMASEVRSSTGPLPGILREMRSGWWLGRGVSVRNKGIKGMIMEDLRRRYPCKGLGRATFKV